MRLSRVFARFYKSFNFDFVRKAAGTKRREWELVGDKWYPFVEVSLDPRITAVVGANESGKSQLLGAIGLAVTGQPFRRKDLCRYCDLFGVEQGADHYPNVGAEWTDFTADEANRLKEILHTAKEIKSFRLFRFGPDKASVWLGEDEIKLDGSQIEAFQALLPTPFSINPDIALPASVPLQWLAGRQENADVPATPKGRESIFAAVTQLKQLSLNSIENIQHQASTLFPILQTISNHQNVASNVTEEQLKLVEDLLFKMAKIDRKSFVELAEAIANGDEGYANGLISKLNELIDRGLNLRRWWVQDRDFSLRLSVREHHVTFTIRDRTGTEYTFDERSHGLRYFLSYLIQSQAAHALGKPLILLMDEPDAHLSAEAQQDLLRIFDDLIDEGGGALSTIQVIYVTHSPFLLDKNHAERIRVLEKGRNLDGTYVIHNAAHNHYEPLRSAFGAFVGESAFIGSVNLVVEGAADQILLAGAARRIRKLPGIGQNETLDLNRVVIVPAGSATQVTYMVHLIRGRSSDQPPVLVLLDSDPEGTKAAEILRQEARFRKLISKSFVMQVGETDFGLTEAIAELEDLLPLTLLVAAANSCISQLRNQPGAEVTVAELGAGEGPIFDRLDALLTAKSATIGKVALARAVVQLADDNEPAVAEAVTLWLERMRRLFQRINTQKREAEARTVRNRNARLVENRVKMFEQDNQTGATKEDVDNLLEDIFIQIDDSPEADAIRQLGHVLRGEFKLKENPTEKVERFEELMTGLKALKDAFQVLKARADGADKSAGSTPASKPAAAQPTAKPKATRKPKAQPIERE